MKMQETLSNIDALVIVHPDYNNPSEVFLEKLAFATFLVDSFSKPVFVVPNYSEESIQQIYERELTNLWEIMPEKEFVFAEELLQSIEIRTNKMIDSLVLGFGGMMYRACVASLAKRTCDVYNGPVPIFDPMAQYKPIQKAYKGIVIKDLCID